MASPVIVTKSGKIRGLEKESHYGAKYFAFYRIPYAKPPLGELRFRDPQKIEPWSDILEAIEEGPSPSGYEKHFYPDPTVVGSEDCLFLNIYTRNLKPPKPLPVLVWIYGGGFLNGTAWTYHYGPDYFMERDDLILVVPQHRVGAFGFLSLSDPELEVPGNAGLKDQRMALRWIKDNISAFGGDADNITAFGCSSGSISLNFQLFSENSRGLFKRAILSSGAAFTNGMFKGAKNLPYRLAQALGYEGDNNERKILKFLREADRIEIVKLQEKLLTPEEKSEGINFAFGPSIEAYTTPDTFMSEPLKTQAQKAWGNEIDVIYNVMSNELTAHYDKLTPKMFIDNSVPDNLYSLIPPELGLERNSPGVEEVIGKIKKVYYGDAIPSMDNRDLYMDLINDRFALYGAHRTLKIRLEHAKNGAKTYFSRFNYDSPDLNLYKYHYSTSKGRKGASHADDMAYLFKKGWGNPPIKGSKDYRNSQTMIELYRNGSVESVSWEPLRSREEPFKCLHLEDTPWFGDYPDYKRHLALDAIFQ